MPPSSSAPLNSLQSSGQNSQRSTCEKCMGLKKLNSAIDNMPEYTLCSCCSRFNRAISYCYDCGADLCTECTKAHIYMNCFKDHRFETLPTAEPELDDNPEVYANPVVYDNPELDDNPDLDDLNEYSWCDLVPEEELVKLSPMEMIAKAISEDDHDLACHYLFAAVNVSLENFFARGGCEINTRDETIRSLYMISISNQLISNRFQIIDIWVKSKDCLNYFRKAATRHHFEEYIEIVTNFVSIIDNACENDVKQVVENVLADASSRGLTIIEENLEILLIGRNYSINYRLK